MINVEEKKVEEKNQLDVNLEENIENKEKDEIIENINFKDRENKKSKIGIIIGIVVLILIVLALTLSTIFAIINSRTNKIVKGIFIENVYVSNITEEEAKQILTELVEKTMQNEIVFKYKEIETPITYEALEVNFDIESAIKEAYSLGRSGNIFENNFEILRTWINGKNIQLKFNFDENVIKQVCENINNSSADAIVEASYYVENDKLIITSGKKGIKVNEEELMQTVNNTIKLNSDSSIIIDVQVAEVEPSPIDLEKIRSEIYKEVKDAYYTNDPFTIYPEVNGVDFDIENAKSIISESKEQYEIPLIITKASKTVQDIGTEAFPDLLATFSTKYNAGETNRTTNLKLSAGKIDGTVLLPGDEFSYNKIVGERTVEAGYKMAATFSGGKVVDGLGGGICQISSTLYDAVVMANLDVTVRRNHQFVTSYLSGGKDATVVWGSQDFKFVNSRKYPIRITATVSGGVATVQVWGVKEEVEYDITIETKKTASIPYTTQYIKDSSLPKGTQKVVQNGNNGSKYEAYKVMRLNGEVVSRTLLSKDTYNAKNKIVKIGTKQ